MFNSQNSSSEAHSKSSFTFQVDDVKETLTRPKEHQFITPEAAFRKQSECKDKIEDFSHRNDTAPKILHTDMNGIMSAVHWAYINHYPLKLSVSDFILMIAQGLAKHMDVYGEELRSHFVNFEGKERIIITRNDLIMGKVNDWSTVFSQFSEEIQKRVKTDFHDVMVDDTTVATKLSRIASEIAIMDAYKHYFEYVVQCICGFPRITLVGSPEDWEKLRSKVKRLKELNTGDKLKLDWWLDRLVPLVNTIVDQAVSRKIDKAFWSNIYQWREEKSFYVPSQLISGWINIFNPYLIDKYSEQVEHKGGKVITKTKYLQNPFGDIHPTQLAGATSRVPFIWKIFDKEYPMTFHGGFLGAQMLEDRTIEPVYFYGVTSDPEPPK